MTTLFPDCFHRQVEFELLGDRLLYLVQHLPIHRMSVYNLQVRNIFMKLLTTFADGSRLIRFLDSSLLSVDSFEISFNSDPVKKLVTSKQLEL